MILAEVIFNKLLCVPWQGWTIHYLSKNILLPQRPSFLNRMFKQYTTLSHKSKLSRTQVLTWHLKLFFTTLLPVHQSPGEPFVTQTTRGLSVSNANNGAIFSVCKPDKTMSGTAVALHCFLHSWSTCSNLRYVWDTGSRTYCRSRHEIPVLLDKDHRVTCDPWPIKEC